MTFADLPINDQRAEILRDWDKLQQQDREELLKFSFFKEKEVKTKMKKWTKQQNRRFLYKVKRKLNSHKATFATVGKWTGGWRKFK